MHTSSAICINYGTKYQEPRCCTMGALESAESLSLFVSLPLSLKHTRRHQHHCLQNCCFWAKLPSAKPISMHTYHLVCHLDVRIPRLVVPGGWRSNVKCYHLEFIFILIGGHARSFPRLLLDGVANGNCKIWSLHVSQGASCLIYTK